MNSVAVAELTLGMMIALDRRIVDEAVDLRRGVWNKKGYSKARGLKGRTLGIVGLGRIGYEVAKRAAAFELKLIYTDVIEHKNIEEELGITKVPFEQLLADADFISLHVPGGGETKHLIGREQLSAMKPTAFIMNCSRGGVVDEVALADAVKAGQIAGAALDVYEIEPAATDKEFADPVVQVSQIYGTHHVGASTEQAQCAVADEVVRIVRNYKETGKFTNCVNSVEAVSTP
jgi:D-3-phosphoglycerate dehydrogenase